VLLAGCGSVVIDKNSETGLVKKGLQAAHAPTTQSIDCPSGVALKLGKTLTCHVTFAGGGGADFTMKVDKVSGHGHMTIVAAKKTSS
jgi:hypothetical protein